MEYLKDLGGERGSPPNFVEVTLHSYLPESSNWLHGVCGSHGSVFIQFVGGHPPHLTVGSTLSIWNFSIEKLHGSTVFVVDFKGSARWVVRQKASGPITPNFAELCCGLGGWTCGMNVMNKSHKEKGHLLMVDINEDVARAAAQTWDLPCMTLTEAYDLVSEGCILCNMVIIGDIHDKRIWTIISLLSIQTVLTSPPCPPWSNAARKEGLSTRDGLVFPILIQMADHVGVRLIVAENVASIMMHEHFETLRVFAKDCGYSLMHSASIDSFPLLPIKRNRWIAAFARHDLIPDNEIIRMVDSYRFPKMRLNPSTMGGRDCIHFSLQDYEKVELQPSALAMVKMCSSDFLPRSFERIPGKSVLQARIRTFHDPLQSAMASYGSQHELDDMLLKDKGLFTTLYSGEKDRGQPRYYSPFEFLASMAWPVNVALPRDIKLAWRAAGNSITIPHVVLALFKTHATLGKNSPWGSKIFNMKDLMSLVFSERISFFRQVINDFRQLEPCTGLTLHSGADMASEANAHHHSSCPCPGQSAVESVEVDHLDGCHEGRDQHVKDSELHPSVNVNHPPANEVPVHLHDAALHECRHDDRSKVRKVMTKDPLWSAANEYVAVSPGVEIAESILESVKTIPRDTSDPSKSLMIQFEGVKDSRREDVFTGKRPFHEEDTWGLDDFRNEPPFQWIDENGLPILNQEFWLRTMENIMFETGVAKIWPMTRMVLAVNIANHWNVLMPVEYHLSVMGMFKKLLPHATSKDFGAVRVNNQDVSPGSVPSGLGKLLVGFYPVVEQILVLLPDGNEIALGCDVTTTCEVLIRQIHAKIDLHPSSFKLVCNDTPINRMTFVFEHKNAKWKLIKTLMIRMPAEMPTAGNIVDLTMPPKHSDVFVPAAPAASVWQQDTRSGQRYERSLFPWMQLSVML